VWVRGICRQERRSPRGPPAMVTEPTFPADDWSDLVAPFWGRVIRSALTGRGMAGLLKAGWTTLKGALVMPLMAEGFRMGTIKFNLITGKKSN